MNRRNWVKQSLILPSLAAAAQTTPQQNSPPRSTDNELVSPHSLIRVDGSAHSLWSLATGLTTVTFAPPAFSINGKTRIAALASIRRAGRLQELGNGIYEQRFLGPFADDGSLSLELIFRIARDSPVVRFRYALHSSSDAALTGDGGQLGYYSTSLAGFKESLEVQLSVFNEMLHSYTVAELPIPQSSFDDQSRLAGPILIACDGEDRSLLIAYEHGAQIPDSFLEYRLTSNRDVSLNARKANYIPGQKVDGFSTVWMQVAASQGGSATWRRSIAISFCGASA